MKISVAERGFFERIQKTAEAETLLAGTRVIAFGKADREHENLLCLPDNAPFTIKQARQIVHFVNTGTLPIQVEDTTIGMVLDWYFNQYLEANEADHEAFRQENRTIKPDANIQSLLKQAIEQLKPLITVAKYPPCFIDEWYASVWENRWDCLLCTHFSARRDLRKFKRNIVQLEEGRCRIGKEVVEGKSCPNFERISELRGRNMTPLEKFYHRMYTRKYLTAVLRWYYHDPSLKFNWKENRRWAEEWADIIAAYEKAKQKGDPDEKQINSR